MYDTDVAAHDNEWWSGSTKRRRRWIHESIKNMRPEQVRGPRSTTFLEVIITDPEMIRSHASMYDPHRTKLPANNQLEALMAARTLANKHFTTIQSHDASEDELSYLKATEPSRTIPDHP